MKFVWALLALVGLFFVLIGAMAVFRVDPPGCRLYSVDKESWVRVNDRLLDEAPVFPGSTLMYETSHGGSLARNRCFAFENSGPYDSYLTFRRYRMPVGAKFADVAAYYRAELASRGWTPPEAWAPLDRVFVRDDAHLTLRSAQGEAFWEFVIDHRRS